MRFELVKASRYCLILGNWISQICNSIRSLNILRIIIIKYKFPIVSNNISIPCFVSRCLHLTCPSSFKGIKSFFFKNSYTIFVLNIRAIFVKVQSVFFIWVTGKEGSVIHKFTRLISCSVIFNIILTILNVIFNWKINPWRIWIVCLVFFVKIQSQVIAFNDFIILIRNKKLPRPFFLLWVIFFISKVINAFIVLIKRPVAEEMNSVFLITVNFSWRKRSIIKLSGDQCQI